jgi:hypothetical protein
MGDHGCLTALMGQNADDDHLTVLDGKVLAFADGIPGEWIRRCLVHHFRIDVRVTAAEER